MLEPTPDPTPKPAQVPGQDAAPASFEAAQAELEALIEGMESGALSLEESLAAYQRGTTLMRFCQARLADVEHQVRVLEDNQLQDFEADGPP